MKFHRYLFAVVLLSLSTFTLAQAEAQKPAAPDAQKSEASADLHQHEAAKAEVAPPTEAQKSFAAMKALEGEWEGPIQTNMPGGTPLDNKAMHVTMRVTSRGNVLVHEFQQAGTPLDPKKYDHPVTMLYLDGGQLNLVHFCDAGNRPHMIAKTSPDGKKLDFEFADLSGGNKTGHMHHIAFTIIDANHHIEEFTYMMPNDKAITARFDLQRVGGASSASGK